MNLFKFDETRDYPFYKNNPRLSKLAWFILLLTVPIAFLVSDYIYIYSEFVSSLVFCLIMLIPLLYFSKWNYNLMFHKPTRNEILLGVLMFIGYIIYSEIVGDILYAFYLVGGGGGTAESLGITLESMVGLIFSLMGEELVKFIILMFFLRLLYKYTENRKISVALSCIVVMVAFGMIHYYPGSTTAASVLALQGAGTIFELYAYIKTKNIFVPYISHMLTDVFIFGLIILGF